MRPPPDPEDPTEPEPLDPKEAAGLITEMQRESRAKPGWMLPGYAMIGAFLAGVAVTLVLTAWGIFASRPSEAFVNGIYVGSGVLGATYAVALRVPTRKATVQVAIWGTLLAAMLFALCVVVQRS